MSMSDKAAKLIFIGSICFLSLLLSFGYGAMVGKLNYWPYYHLLHMAQGARSLLTMGKIVPRELLRKVPPHVSRQPVTIHNADLRMDGYYIVVGWNDASNNYAAQLYDHEGDTIHTWVIDYDAFDPDGPANGSDSPHGFEILADGSIVVSFDKGDIITRIDACGQPIWVRKGIFHHSIQSAEDGSLWAWRAHRHPDAQYQYLVNLDVESGATIRELSLIDDIIKKADETSIIFGMRPDYEFVKYDTVPSNFDDYDIFHPNDIDVLHSDLAANFPEFNVGDLLISLRQLHLVAVLDSKSGQPKWWNIGPWRLQHDPDFAPDGTISVYNNNSDRTWSEIIKVDPVTRAVSNDLLNGEVRFYSNSMGKHQYLPNGNILIVVPQEGRMIEVSKDGEMVIEFSNVVSNEYNGHVQNGLWVATDFFDTLPTCDEKL